MNFVENVLSTVGITHRFAHGLETVAHLCSAQSSPDIQKSIWTLIAETFYTTFQQSHSKVPVHQPEPLQAHEQSVVSIVHNIATRPQ